MIIDAKDSILGRIATVAAKKALLGEKVFIVNCRDAVITGNEEDIIERFKRRLDMGVPRKGPFHSVIPEKIVKRAVRNMLPYKKPRGREAFKRIRCYNEVPEELKDKKMEKIPSADISKSNASNFMYLKDIYRILKNR